MATLTAEAVIAKIRELNGNLAAVARAFRVSRSTVYRFLETHPTVQQALTETRETMLDNAESVLYSKVLAGDTVALIFFLKTQGRRRGYVERVEQSGPVRVHVVYDDDSDHG